MQEYEKLYSIDGLPSVIMKMLYNGSDRVTRITSKSVSLPTTSTELSDLAVLFIAVETTRASASDRSCIIPIPLADRNVLIYRSASPLLLRWLYKHDSWLDTVFISNSNRISEMLF